MSKANLSGELTFKKGFLQGLPIAMGYIPASMAISIALTQMGLSLFTNSVFSALTYSATGQLIFANYFKAGEASVFAYILSLFIVNFRYVIFGVAISQKMHPSMKLWERMLFGALHTDENYVVAMRNEGKLKAPYLLGLAFSSFLGFFGGALLGASFTDALPPSVLSAFGIAVTGLLIAMLVPAAKKSKKVAIVVAIAVGLSCILSVIPFTRENLTAPQNMIICTVITALIGALLFPVKDEEIKEAA